MAIYGADVAQLKDLSDAFSRAADKIDANRMVVGHRIQLRIWVGPIAAQFRLAWDSQYSRMLHAVAEDLHRAATQLLENAYEQEKASLAGTTLAGTSNWVAHLPTCSEDWKESLKQANPHFNDNQDFWADLFRGRKEEPPTEWANNCGYASIAYDMRRRGYDVTAVPDTDGDLLFSLASAFHDPQTGLPRDWTQTGSEAATVEAMERYGPGVRALVYIQFKDGGGGHCFVVENMGGEVRFLDPQSGTTVDSVAARFKNLEPGQMLILRTDDQEPTMNDMVVRDDE